MKRIGWVIAVTLPLLGAPVLAKDKRAYDDATQSVKMHDLPGTVQDTLREEAGGGKIEELRKKGDKGTEIYRAEIVTDGKEHELDVNPAGKVVKRGQSHDSTEHERGEK